jgi:MFS transporter, LPLT family, lysophospholipid transporter
MRQRSVYALLIAQFLSAFADNAVLFTVVAIAMQHPDTPSWYISALQSAFLVAFVVLAPWVGHWSDRFAKAKLLTVANLIKAAGSALLLMDVDSLMAYGLVGIGAAIYSPAKYGILPELAEHAFLVKINGWVEGSTILAILGGMLAGAKIADYNLQLAIIASSAMFLASAAATLILPKTHAAHSLGGSALPAFWLSMKQLLSHLRARFSLMGTSMFWGTAAAVRVIIIAWAPLVLQLKDAGDIAELTLFLALGIMIGAAVVPYLITLEHLRKVRFPAYLMALAIIALGFVDNLTMARTMLFLIGLSGGLFLVPINAALQEAGHQSVGSGNAVALQNFFENVAMLITVGGYSYVASLGLDPVSALQGLGALTLLAAVGLVLSLPKNTADFG